MAAEGAPDRTAVLALRQTAGRGRRGRAWQFTDGNLALSLIVDGGTATAPPGLLSLAVGIAVTETCETLGARVQLKWPNDIVIGPAKLGGILIEAAGSARYVIGIGMNVASAPEIADRPVTALAVLMNPLPSLDALLEALTPSLMRWVDIWAAGESAAIAKAWLARAQGLGQTITLMNGTETITGIFRGIAADGALRLEAHGIEREFHAGETSMSGG